MKFITQFTPHFRSYRRDVSEQARQYLKGLMQASPRKNMERMAEVVPDSDQQALQQFISQSRWDFRAVIADVAHQANQLLGHAQEAGLLLDETSFVKKGHRSVGVARQYLGRLGKVENGQVAVFGTLSRQNRTAPVDVRLFLPEEWTQNPERCEQAGIPRQERQFKTKKELALEIVAQARQDGLQFGWVGADAGYGSGLDFLEELERRGEPFLIDVHKDQLIYLTDPAPAIPPRQNPGRGRPRQRRKAQSRPMRADQWAAQAQPSQWQTITLRDASKGKLRVEILHARIWVWDSKWSAARQWHLLVRRDAERHDDHKYSLSNAAPSMSARQLAVRQGQRFWVERFFEDSKSECGMADYQVQGWVAWHHHMALAMMAMLFMALERKQHQESHPLLSCADIEALLARFLPRRDLMPQEVIAQLEARHKKRRAAIDSAHSLQKKRLRRK